MEGDVMPLHKEGGRHAADLRNIQADDIFRALLRNLPYVSYGDVESDMAEIAAPAFSITNSLVVVLPIAGPKYRFTARAVATRCLFSPQQRD